MLLGQWLYCYLEKKYGVLDLGVDIGVIDFGLEEFGDYIVLQKV